MWCIDVVCRLLYFVILAVKEVDNVYIIEVNELIARGCFTG
jgi:hypothetical protein